MYLLKAYSPVNRTGSPQQEPGKSCREMDGWMDRWTDEWMDGWTDGWMDGWIFF